MKNPLADALWIMVAMAWAFAAGWLKADEGH